MAINPKDRLAHAKLVEDSDVQRSRAARLAALCEEHLSNECTPWMPLAKVREILLPDNPDAYREYADFKRKVLVAAMAEIQETFPLRLELEVMKEDGKVTHVRLLIAKRAKLPAIE